MTKKNKKIRQINRTEPPVLPIRWNQGMDGQPCLAIWENTVVKNGI